MDVRANPIGKQCLCDSLLLCGEDCDIADRSRVDRDGGKTHICQKDLEQNTPHGTGIFKESSLVKAKSSMCCPLGILARMDSEQISVESKPFLVWSDFSPSFPTICFCCKAVSLMKRDRRCWGLPRLERLSGPTCTLRLLLSGQHSGVLHGMYREFG